MFAFLDHTLFGWPIGTILMLTFLICYVVFLFRIARPGSLRLDRKIDGLGGSLRITARRLNKK